MSLALSLLFALTPAIAGKADNALLVHRVTGDEVAALLVEVGQVPQLGQDELGDPLVRSRAGDVDYVVLFYDCDPEQACRSVQFRAWYSRARGVDEDVVRAWNRTSRLGRAYLDRDLDPTLEHNVRLHGGVTPEHLRAERDWFLKGLATFRDVLTDAAVAPADPPPAER